MKAMICKNLVHKETWHSNNFLSYLLGHMEWQGLLLRVNEVRACFSHMFYFERTYTNYSIGKGKIVCMGRKIKMVTSCLVINKVLHG